MYCQLSDTVGNAACRNFASFRPALLADWDDVTFVHFAVDPASLRPLVPFELDLFDGAAYISLVAFTQRNLRPRVGGRLTAMLSAPLASHEFLNVRTYVRHEREQGIYFLCEWIPNRLATWLGPPLYGLPYRLGRLSYQYDRRSGTCRHRIADGRASLVFDAVFDPSAPPTPAAADTLEAFLLERYVAFTCCRGSNRRFRVSHLPWLLHRADIQMRDTTLLTKTAMDWAHAPPVAGHYSAGVKEVGLGPPVRIGKRAL